MFFFKIFHNIAYKVESYMEKRPYNLNEFPNLLFLKGKSYKNELLDISKIRNLDYKIYQSITDELGKIVYISKVNVLSITDEK